MYTYLYTYMYLTFKQYIIKLSLTPTLYMYMYSSQFPSHLHSRPLHLVSFPHTYIVVPYT